MKIIIYLIVCLISSNILRAQIGVNTTSPFGILHIDGAKDNSTSIISTISTNQEYNDLIIDNAGNVGVGVTSPKVKLDMRNKGTNTQNSLGIGDASLTANVAGEGSLRYHNSTMEYSNDIEWITLSTTEIPQKVIVIKANNVLQSFPNDQTTIMANWPISYFNNTSPDAFSTNVFTAPKTAIYTVSGSFTFSLGSIMANTYVRILFQVLDSTNNIIDQNACLSSFSVGGGNSYAADNCSMNFYLISGQKVRLALYHNLGSAKPLRIDSPGFQNFAIIEN